jgi:DNA-binding NtrC family response regulator
LDDSACGRTAPEFSELFAERSREWVAILPRELAHTAQVKRLIADCFFDFHTLPIDTERVITTLGHAYGMASLQDCGPQKTPLPDLDTEMVGCSTLMLALFRNIRKVAGTDATVLISGETGTGKELTAQAIHERSARANQPFVTINCGAIPDTLIQAELFGHEKGAFTGATQRKIGRLEAANGGTVFLDEIGDLPLDQQTNLLRFLQEKQVDRIGGQAPVAVDVRIIAATHVDLEQAVALGRFREDLYHRLNVLCLRVPSLRDREGDIKLMANHFFRQFAAGRGKSLRGFSREAIECINSYQWPGNVRELINRIRRAAVMCDGRIITPKDLGLADRCATMRQPTLEEARNQAEIEVIRAGLERNDHNLTRTARELDIARITLYRLLEKHKIAVRNGH